MDITHALLSLRPGAAWQINGSDYDNLEWLDKAQTKPTQEEVEAEVARLQADWDRREYQRIRATQYPALAEQLDMLWHAMDTGALPKVDEFYSAIKAVKDANPKQ